MQEISRVFFINSARKLAGESGSIKETRLALEFLDMFQSEMKNPNVPK